MIGQVKKKGLKRKISRVAADPIDKLKVWVLYPYLQTDDPNLKYYYDFSQSLKEYTAAFEELKADWTWQPATTDNYPEVIASIKKKSGRKIPVVLNLVMAMR
jgi:D-alanine-D-alanine ligase